MTDLPDNPPHNPPQNKTPSNSHFFNFFVDRKSPKWNDKPNIGSLFHIGTDRQLFLEKIWIAEAQGVMERINEPVRREVVIFPEHPWERGGVSNMVT